LPEINTYLIYELIGYTASILVAISLMMSKIVKLRIVNMIGAVTFTIYGILINSIPVASVNALIVCVNIYYLGKIYTSKEYFKLLRVSISDEYLKHFIEFYREDIYEFQPGFSYQPDQSDLALMVLRDMIPAGVLIGKRDSQNRKILIVELDFVIPRYRDFKIGRFLYHKKKDFFIENGISLIKSPPGSEQHQKYLEEMEFRKAADQNWYGLKLERID